MRAVTWTFLSILLFGVVSCGGGGAPSNPIVFSETTQAGPNAGEITDTARGIRLSFPPGTFGESTEVRLEVKSHQSGGMPNGFMVNPNAINITVDVAALAELGSLQLEIPFTGDFDSFRTVVSLTDGEGHTYPLDASYDAARHVVIGLITKDALSYAGRAAGRAGDRRQSGAYWANRADPSELPSGGFKIFVPEVGGRGSLRELTQFDTMAGKRIAVVVHGWDNVANDMIDLARFLDQESGKYDEVWAYEYNFLARISDCGRQLRIDLEPHMAGAEIVDLYGHSMGGLVCRWAMEREELGSSVHRLVTLGTPHQGVPKRIAQLLWLLGLGHSTADMAEGSAFLSSLNGQASSFRASAKYYTLAGDSWGDYFIGPLSERVYNPSPIHVIDHDGLVQKDSAWGVDVLGNKSDSWQLDPTCRTLVHLTHSQVNGEPESYDGTCGFGDASHHCDMVRAVRPWLPESGNNGSFAFVDLNPAGYIESRVRACSDDGVWQVGSAKPNGQSSRHAGIWQGTSTSFADLNPDGAEGSDLMDVSNDGSAQVGSYKAPGQFQHAYLWHSNPSGGVDLNPQSTYPGDNVYSFATAITRSGDKQLGYHEVWRQGQGNTYVQTGLLWEGTNVPIGFFLQPPLAYYDRAIAPVCLSGVGGVAAGDVHYRDGYRACAWTSPTVPIVMHPEEFEYSSIFAVSRGATAFVGQARGYDGSLVALKWTSLAGTYEVLHPFGFDSSIAHGVSPDGTKVVGWAIPLGGESLERALLWNGGAADYVDLQSVLGPGYRRSWAYAIDEHGNVYGEAETTDLRVHAIKWVRL